MRALRNRRIIMQSSVNQSDGIVLARGACVDVIGQTSHARRRDGDQKEVRTQIRKSEVRPRSEQECRECDASPQEGHVAQRTWRQGRQGEEPEAGNRDRTLRGAKKGREGPSQELLAKEWTQELEKGRLTKERTKELAQALVVGSPPVH